MYYLIHFTQNLCIEKDELAFTLMCNVNNVN